MKDLTKTELVIMKCIWGSEERLTATQIQKIMNEEYGMDTDRKTVGALLYRLEKNGYVDANPNKNCVNLFTPIISYDEMKIKATRDFLKNWFDGKYDDMLSALYTIKDEKTAE